MSGWFSIGLFLCPFQASSAFLVFVIRVLLHDSWQRAKTDDKLIDCVIPYDGSKLSSCRFQLSDFKSTLGSARSEQQREAEAVDD